MINNFNGVRISLFVDILIFYSNFDIKVEKILVII